jgi:hypothetical protein
LCIVHPDTVVRWQRERFRRYWAQLSNRSGRTGRPPVSSQIRTLIRTLAQANPLWRAPRIHGELKKLGTIAPDQARTLLLAFVNGKLLAEGEVLQDDRLMTFSKEPNQSK